MREDLFKRCHAVAQERDILSLIFRYDVCRIEAAGHEMCLHGTCCLDRGKRAYRESSCEGVVQNRIEACICLFEEGTSVSADDREALSCFALEPVEIEPPAGTGNRCRIMLDDGEREICMLCQRMLRPGKAASADHEGMGDCMARNCFEGGAG